MAPFDIMPQQDFTQTAPVQTAPEATAPNAENSDHSESSSPPAAPDIFAQIGASEQANPQAHDFGNVVTPAEAADTVPGGPITLHEALGLAGKPLVRKGVTFVQQSPALEDLDDIMEVQQQIQGAKTGKALITLASFVLYVADPSAPDTLRRATAQEIGKSFSMHDLPVLSDVLARNLNMTESGSPNAPAPAGA